MSTVVTCRCTHCQQELEFEQSRDGEIVKCPSCGSDTALEAPVPPFKIKDPWSRTPRWLDGVGGKAPKPASRGIWIVLLLTAIGAGLVLVGCNGDLHESVGENGSAIRQAVYTIQYCTGFLLVGIAAILDLLRRQ